VEFDDSVVFSKVRHISSARVDRMIVHISNTDEYSLWYSCCYQIDERGPDQQGNMERLKMEDSKTKKRGIATV
jgi:hypothetical protein